MKRLLDMLFFSFAVPTFVFLVLAFVCWSFEGGAIVYRALVATSMVCYIGVNAIDFGYGQKTPYFYDKFILILKKI